METIWGYIEEEKVMSRRAVGGRSRMRKIVEVRELAVWLMRKEAEMKTEDIGKEIKRDHSTVVVMLKKIKNMMEIYKDYRKEMEEELKKYKQYKYSEMGRIALKLELELEVVNNILGGLAMGWKENAKRAMVEEAIGKIMLELENKGVDTSQSPYKAYKELCK